MDPLSTYPRGVKEKPQPKPFAKVIVLAVLTFATLYFLFFYLFLVVIGD